jgi:hypothetical protein
MIYQRRSDGVLISFQPADSELARRAASDIGIEVGSTIDDGTAADVRQRYKELHVKKHGESSPFAGEI